MSGTGGFGGMVAKPWDQRKRTAPQLQMEAAAGLSRSRASVYLAHPAARSRAGDFRWTW